MIKKGELKVRVEMDGTKVEEQVTPEEAKKN